MTPRRIHMIRTIKIRARFATNPKPVHLTRARVYDAKRMQELVTVTVAYAERNQAGYIRRAHRVVHRAFGPEVAADSVPEGFLDALLFLRFKTDGAMPESAFLSVLYRAAISRAVKIVRPVQKRGGGLPPSLSLDMAVDEGGSLADTLAAPEIVNFNKPVTEQDEKVDLIMKLISELPKPRKECLLLVDVEGLQYEEVAEMLSLPTGTVKSSVYQARVALRKRLPGGN